MPARIPGLGVEQPLIHAAVIPAAVANVLIIRLIPAAILFIMVPAVAVLVIAIADI
jgi:hypothetical protein